MYDYMATVTNIHDGDTVTLQVDLGFGILRSDHFRFYGINAPELSTQAGKDALEFLKTLLRVGDTIEVKTHKDAQEKYGRYLAELFIPGNPVSVNDQMVSSGHAVVYLPK